MTTWSIFMSRTDVTSLPESSLKAIGKGAYLYSSNYILTKDIDASASKKENCNGDECRGFSPIGRNKDAADSTYFSGIFDGQNHTIRNLYVQGIGDELGLISLLCGSVKNVKLDSVNVMGSTTSSGYVGGVVGFARGTIENVHVTNSSIQGQVYVGGIAGAHHQSDSHMSDVSYQGEVKAVRIVGGITGSSHTNIFNASANVRIVVVSDREGGRGSFQVGGIAGYAEISIHESHSSGVIVPNALNIGSVGGLVGESRSDIYFCSSSVDLLSVSDSGKTFVFDNRIGGLDANFDREGHEAFFWSASENGFTTAKLMNLDNLDYLSSFLTGYAKEYFFNIRCVDDGSYVPTPRPVIKYDSIVDSRDGQVYKTIKIGNLNWMAQNLNYEAKDSHCYDDSLKYCKVYGRLYSWASAIDSAKLANDKANPQDCGYGKICQLPAVVQGACPNGWHLPTSDEWSVLFTEVGGQGSAAKYLKSMMKWNGTDSVGFSVLPAGSSTQNGYRFSSEGRDAYFWTATEIYDGNDAYFVHMETSNSYVFLYSVEKTNGYSVRCVEDGGVIASTVPDEGFDWELSRDSYLNPNINYDSIVDNRDTCSRNWNMNA